MRREAALLHSATSPEVAPGRSRYRLQVYLVLPVKSTACGALRVKRDPASWLSGQAERSGIWTRGLRLSESHMTTDQFVVTLAERVLHWRATPERFLTGNRGWLPRWKFQPNRILKDAVRLLEATAPETYSINADGRGFRVSVQIGGAEAEFCCESEAQAITYAVARALGLELPE